MSEKLPSQAQFWGIREREMHVLMVITHWFNGNHLTIRDEKRQLGTHYELPLEDLFRAHEWDYESHQQAHERLLSNDLLKEEYVARRKIDWSPTEQGRQAIRDCLKPWSDQLRPWWADEDESGPLFGDPNEGTLHRKGVETAALVFSGVSWAYDIGTGRSYGIERYPEDERGEACHDVHIRTNEHTTNVGIEVVTSSKNLGHLVSKWHRYQDRDRRTLWLFDRRETACRLWNKLDGRGDFYLDGRFTDYGNWSAKATNRKIWRSSQEFRGEPAGDLVQTVTGLLEGRANTIHELFEDYHSRN